MFLLESNMTIAVIKARTSNCAACAVGAPFWRRRVAWVGLGLVALAGLAFNWHWLVIAGALPILLGVLPCVAMCALHLCSSKQGKPPADRAHPSQ
jgi:hypothetical protein